jgi:hypothetical protein
VPWQPVAAVADPGLAETIVVLLSESSPGQRAMVVAVARLASEVGGEEAERILDRVHNPTTAETRRAVALERRAREQLAQAAGDATRWIERRSDVDRRSGMERRVAESIAVGGRSRALEVWAGRNRRSGRDRRSGTDRRRTVARRA